MQAGRTVPAPRGFYMCWLRHIDPHDMTNVSPSPGHISLADDLVPEHLPQLTPSSPFSGLYLDGGIPILSPYSL